MIEGSTVREHQPYWYKGIEQECDCKTQIALRIHYLAAGIGDHFMRLDWMDYIRSPEIREKLQDYVANWSSFRKHGIGLELRSESLGSGKTLLACCVGKELVKQGYKVFFIPFTELISIQAGQDTREMARRMTETNLLIIDELRLANSERQKALYQDLLERVVRERTSYNLPIIITTNLQAKSLSLEFPRTYSLLAAKQMTIEMPGSDHRLSKLALEDIEMAYANEIKPIG